uniref:Phosphatidylglycerol--prolipoprotein diacylglyceryl transferase n=1 Tax=uncultured Bacteroidota bacterium TaxID=152509 RepID=H5SNU5_9BACT|nr:beta-galactosamide-alpha-2,3-sialyltransferase [uncultured Bacteroidetes bacterium]
MIWGYIRWNASPEILSVGPLTLRWYGLLFATGFFVGFYIMQWIYRTEKRPEKDLDTLLWYLLIGTVVGARLGHCLFYEPAYYLSHPWDILKVWEGGLASHGGTAGVVLALYLYSQKRPDQPFLWVADRLTVPTALAATCIRLGNLFNSEIYGKITTLPWAFIFERVDPHPRHPTQLYEAIAYLTLFFLLLALYRKGIYSKWHTGKPLGFFFLWVFGMRFVIEWVKEPQEAFDLGLPLNMGQLLSIPFLLVGLYLFLRKR